MYIADNLIKMNCLDCKAEVIVSEYAAKKHNMDTPQGCYCPYCGGRNTEWVACTDEGTREGVNDSLGCLGLYHDPNEL